MNIVTEMLYRLGFSIPENKTCYLRDKDELVKVAEEKYLLPSGDYKLVVLQGAKMKDGRKSCD